MGENAIGITSFGGYIPRRRLSRKSIAEANAWLNPGLMGRAKGERAMANWDEDSVTMAVEAARDCLTGRDRDRLGAVYLASTTLPFADRQNAGIVSAALSLSENISATDITSCQKAGTSAVLAGANAVKAGGIDEALVVASDQRKTRAGAMQEMQFGDGAAALTLGSTDVVATLIGHASVTVDFVDHFRGDEEEFDYQWEERWIRDEGFSKIVPQAVSAVFERTGLSGSDIDHFVLPCLFPRIPQKIAKICGIDPERTVDNLGSNCGETGTAHTLVMLVHTLEQAKPGEKILVASFGQGCEAIIFETTDELSKVPSKKGITGSLANRKEETNYVKWLAFNGLIEFEKGMRAEKDVKTALTVSYRKRDMLFGLTGGKCSTCGTAQFPRTRICVNPNCQAVDTQEPYSFAEQTGKVLSWSADFLTFSMDPPSHFGMITFEDGGRFMADLTDVDVGTVDSGTEVRMAFRVKDVDEKRGYRRYFWKAVPQTQTQQAAE